MSRVKVWVALALCWAAHASGARAAAIAAAASRLPQAACVAWNRAATVTLQGTTQSEGLSGTFSLTLDTRTGRYVAKREFGIYAVADGFDGKLDWTRDRSGASHFLDSAAARAISITQSWLRRRGWCDPVAERAAISALPGEMTDALWRVTPRGGVPVLLWFDRSTGLPRQSELRLPFNRLIRHYGEWRATGAGVIVPWLEKDEDPEDESVETVELTSATAGERTPPTAVFAKPGLPRDYAVLGNQSSATVKYEDDGIGRIYVPVLIDGKGPFAFEVDTGGHLRLESETALQANLSAVGNLSNTGGGTGIAHGGVVRIQEIRIGAAVMRGQVANVLTTSKAANDRGTRPPRGGLLGLELFERFVVQLDRAAKTMTLIPLESFHGTPNGTPLPIRFNEDAPLARGTFNGIAGEFELDSGDAGPAIIEGFWAQEHGLAERLSRGLDWSGSGVGGEYKEVLTRGDFTLGPIALPHEVVSYVGLVERGSESTRMQAGVIGESSLYRFDMTYDYGHQRVWISPNPKVPARAFNRAGLRLKRDANDGFVVTMVVTDSAAEAAGLKAGDRILAVNGRPAAELSSADLLVTLSGPVGSELELLVASQGSREARPTRIQLREMLP
jgi:hypothetical protein